MRTVLSKGFTGGIAVVTAGVGEGTEGVAVVSVTSGVALFRVTSGVAVGGKISGSRLKAGVASSRVTQDGSRSLRSAMIFSDMKLSWYGVMASLISGTLMSAMSFSESETADSAAAGVTRDFFAAPTSIIYLSDSSTILQTEDDLFFPVLGLSLTS